MNDLVITNGMVVSPYGTLRTDVAIKDGKISAMGDRSQLGEAKRTIDAAGKYLLPGVIDAHMHIEAPFQGCIGANDFYTQSVAAAFGGVTTFMDFTNTFKGTSLVEAVRMRKEEMSKSAIDYGIHVKIVEAPESILEEIGKVAELGCPSLKLFMTYKKEGVMADDETMVKVFQKAKEHNALTMIHAENNAIAETNIEQFSRQGKLGWTDFPLSKPVLCEAEAVSRAVHLSKYVGNAVLIVHTTNGEALENASRAQREGHPVYVETCPQYLMLSDELYNDPELGYLAICSPPLRAAEEAEKLWDGIRNGSITVTGSDDCAYSKEEKSMFLQKDADGAVIPDFTKVVNGVAGIETRLPILLSEGVSKGRISINKVCEITSTNVAKLFGCFPQKGIIAPGSDADIVLVDMDKEVTISPEVLHNNLDYSLYEGLVVKGYPVMTIAKGKVIVEDGIFRGNRGDGQFLHRSIDPAITAAYNK